jgi:hypothetical protein
VEDAILVLVKFFKGDHHEYAEQFLNGKLFMNRLSYFRSIEGTDGRSDKHEATAMWWQPHNLSIQFKDHPELNIGPKDLGGPVSVTFDYHSDFHIFCMSAMSTGEFEFVNGTFDCPTEEHVRKLRQQLEFSEECLKLGDIAVAVNATEFMARVKRAIDQNGYQLSASLVRYYDPETFHGTFRHGDIPFRKRKEFNYQKEFRIVVDNNTRGHDALEIEIGDIRNISGRMVAANLNNEFTIRLVE